MREQEPAGHTETSKSQLSGSELAHVLLESMTEGVSLSTEVGTIIYSNAAEDSMFGYEPGELVGQHVSVQNAYPPAENDKIVGEVLAALGLRRSESVK